MRRGLGSGLDPEGAARKIDRSGVTQTPGLCKLAGWPGCLAALTIYLASLSHAAAQSPDATPIFTLHAVTACPIAQHELRQKG